MEPAFLQYESEPPARVNAKTQEYVTPLLRIDSPEPRNGLYMFAAFAIPAFLVYKGVLHWAWALLIFMAVIIACVKETYDSFRQGVRIYQDGIISRSDDGPLAKTKTWAMYPWSHVVDIDLRNGRFAINHIGLPTIVPGVAVLMKIKGAQAKSIAERLEALQVRGDIPQNIKVWSK
jgi:hypothetical protein